VAAELNVVDVESFASAGDLVDHSAKGNFRSLGRRFGKQTPRVAEAIASADAEQLAERLAEHGSAVVDFEGGVEVTSEDVIISERPREGWSVVNEHGETIALDLHLTPDLVRQGLAREVVRMVQDARKSNGFDVSDRIVLTWAGAGETAQALEEHAELVAREVLSVRTERVDEAGADWQRDDELGVAFLLEKA
jgi:isoleucyl-tRNA synthetase